VGGPLQYDRIDLRIRTVLDFKGGRSGWVLEEGHLGRVRPGGCRLGCSFGRMLILERENGDNQCEGCYDNRTGRRDPPPGIPLWFGGPDNFYLDRLGPRGRSRFGLHPMSVSREDVAEIGVAVTLRPTSCVEVQSGEQPAAQEPFKVTKDDSVAAAPDVGKLPAAHAVVQHVAGQVMSGTAITAHSPERGWVTN